MIPLTAVRAAPEELIGTARPAPAVDTTATRVLTKGEPIAAPSGRADDFSWPRGNVTLEPAANDPTRRPTPPREPPSRPPIARTGGGCPGRCQTAETKPAPPRRPRPRAPNPYDQQRSFFGFGGGGGGWFR